MAAATAIRWRNRVEKPSCHCVFPTYFFRFLECSLFTENSHSLIDLIEFQVSDSLSHWQEGFRTNTAPQITMLPDQPGVYTIGGSPEARGLGPDPRRAESPEEQARRGPDPQSSVVGGDGLPMVANGMLVGLS